MKKSIVAGLSITLGASLGTLITGKLLNKSMAEYTNKVDKFKSYYYLLNQWLAKKYENHSLDEYFISEGIHTIAIYGMGEVGNRLYEELKNSNVVVKYAIDKNSYGSYGELKVMNADADFEDVDAVVITTPFAYDEIINEIGNKFTCPIISIDEIVYK